MARVETRLKQVLREMDHSETGVSIVARVETRLKQVLREMDHSVMGRGSEVFRINPEELFQIIKDISVPLSARPFSG